MTIELANIRFKYSDRPEYTVLNIPNWSLQDGEQILMQGPSGCGKSTLLGVLSGLLKPTNGQVTIFNQRLDKMTIQQRDKFRAVHIGYVFQQFNLVPYLSPIDNILLANHFSGRKNTNKLIEEIKTLLITLNIAEQEWYRPTRDMSIGQQQRVAIARALINKPRLLIADEPTSSLDTVNRDIFMQLLMSIVAESKMTLVFVSHDLSLSSYFKKVESLNDINKLGDLA